MENPPQIFDKSEELIERLETTIFEWLTEILEFSQDDTLICSSIAGALSMTMLTTFTKMQIPYEDSREYIEECLKQCLRVLDRLNEGPRTNDPNQLSEVK